MPTIGFYCDPDSIENNAMSQLQQYAEKSFVNKIGVMDKIVGIL